MKILTESLDRLRNFIISPYKLDALIRFQSRVRGIEDWQIYISNNISKHKKNLQENSIDKDQVIIFSVSQDRFNPGCSPYNGGIKLINIWAKILVQNNHKVYIATHHGKFVPWLIEHQEHISIKEVEKMKQNGVKITFVTTWLMADEFINLADKIYYFDAEIFYTAREHKNKFDELLKSGKIAKIGTHTQAQAAWYLQNVHIDPHYIKEWSDTDYWKPNIQARVRNRVGYMLESVETEVEISEIDAMCKRKGLSFEFIKIKGNEQTVIREMQTCTYFLGMNHGKDIVWGEGCPRSQQESVHAGCILIAFDVVGNREIVIDGNTGFLVPNKRADIMATKLIKLHKNKEELKIFAKNSLNFASISLSPRGRYEQISKFLDLTCEPTYLIENIDELSFLMQNPIFLTSPEVRTLAKYAKQSKKVIVEIGSAFGASSSILLAHAQDGVPVFSIDPFVQDSNGSFSASAKKCKRNVKRVLSKLKMSNKSSQWFLLEDYSFNIIKEWDKPIGMLFIDGDHRFNAVKKDFNDWFPKVTRGGYILIHDSCRQPRTKTNEYNRGWQGPTQLAKELLHFNGLKYVESISSITVWQKK